MNDEFRQKIVDLRDSYAEQEADQSAGKGIRPANHEAGIQAKLLDRVLKLYDKHYVIHPTNS